MRRVGYPQLFLGSFVFVVMGSGCGSKDDGDASVDGNDTETNTETETESNTSTEDTGEQQDCPTNVGWYDETSGLCWQEPPFEDTMTWQEAMEYCNNLILGGFDDWKMPKIQDLCSFTRGCTTNQCQAYDPDCLTNECVWSDPDCLPCEELAGPAPNGQYWDPELDASIVGFFWSSSPNTGDAYEGHYWRIGFASSIVASSEDWLPTYIRCFRGDSL